MTFEAETWTSPTGADLAVRLMPAQGAPVGAISLNHGLAEHGLRYQRFAAALSRAGFHVVIHDHRGHGFTRSQDSERGVFAYQDGADMALTDAAFVRSEMRRRFDDAPLIVFGHSMGGLFTANAAIDEHDAIAGAAIWNTNLTLGPLAGVMRLVLLVEGAFRRDTEPSDWLAALTFGAWAKRFNETATGSDWLSRIPEEVKAYAEDPLCGWDASISMWRDFVRLVERAEARANLLSIRRDLAWHIAGGGQDPATNEAKATRAFADRLINDGFTDVSVRIDPEARHETLNDLGADQAMEDFIVWARTACAS
ncbi:MAG: alpha/beta hydrolase [Pseudomonadota bacterium]